MAVCSRLEEHKLLHRWLSVCPGVKGDYSSILPPHLLFAADGPPPIEVVVKLALQIAQGLQELHANGILYEDFKPQK